MSLPRNAARGLLRSQIHETAAERKRKTLSGSYTAEAEQLSKYCIPFSCPHFQNRLLKPVKRFQIKLHSKTGFKFLEGKVTLKARRQISLGEEKSQEQEQAIMHWMCMLNATPALLFWKVV